MACSSKCHVTESTFLFQLGGGILRIEMGQEVLLHSHNKYTIELQTFRSMHRHHRYGTRFLPQVIQVGSEGDLIEERREGVLFCWRLFLELFDGGEEFVKVFHSGVCFHGILLPQHRPIS